MATTNTELKYAWAVVAALLTACVVQPTPSPELVHHTYLPLVVYDTVPTIPTVLTYGNRGIAGWPTDDLHYDAYYNWYEQPSVTDPRLARMVCCASDNALVRQQVVDAAKLDAENDIVGRVWLLMNEPDFTSCDVEPSLCGCQRIDGHYVHSVPELAAHNYVTLTSIILSNDPNAVLFAGGLFGPGTEFGQWWWGKFATELVTNGELGKIHGVHIHVYPCWSADTCDVGELLGAIDGFVEFNASLGLGDRPLWVTETGCSPFCGLRMSYDACATTVMQPVLDWCDTRDVPCFWFIPVSPAWPCTQMMEGEELTAVGQTWNDRYSSPLP